MHIFDPNAIRIEIVRAKTISQAVGGSIQIERNDNGTVSLHRYDLSLSLAKSLIKQLYGMSKFIKPVVIGLMWYDGVIVAAEAHPLGGLGEETVVGVDGTEKSWTPSIATKINSLIARTFNTNDWYFDGRYIYRPSSMLGTLRETLEAATAMSSCGRFRAIDVDALDMYHLHWAGASGLTTRQSVGYISDGGMCALTPPAWTSISEMRELEVASDNEDYEYTSVYSDVGDKWLDQMDQTRSINLEFVLAAAKTTANLFGYKAIECLELPRLMVDLRTVNLLSLPLHVKKTFQTGFSPSNMLAWACGISLRCTEVEQAASMRKLLSQFRKAALVLSDEMAPHQVYVSSVPSMPAVVAIPLTSSSDAASIRATVIQHMINPGDRHDASS